MKKYVLESDKSVSRMNKAELTRLIWKYIIEIKEEGEDFGLNHPFTSKDVLFDILANLESVYDQVHKIHNKAESQLD